MYILKKLNREKKVETAADAAVLLSKGWIVVEEVNPEKEKKSWEEPEIAQKKQEEATGSDENPEPEEQLGQDAESEPEEQSEKKPTSKRQKKE